MGAAKRKEKAVVSSWWDAFLSYQPHLADCDRDQLREVHEALRSIQIDPTGLLGQVVYRKVGDWAAPLLTPHGLLGLILKGAGIAWADCRAVYEADTFALDYGQPFVQHAPYAGDKPPGPLIGAYVIAALPTGQRFVEFTPGAVAAASGEIPEFVSADKMCQRAALQAFALSCPMDLWWLHAGLEIETRVLEARRPIAPWLEKAPQKPVVIHGLEEVAPEPPEELSAG
jgi:hypothetical protein